MYKYSATSTRKLNTCDPRLQRWAYALAEHRDCTVVTGYRGPEDQALAFKRGLSKLKPGESTHNVWPSRGIDIVPAVACKAWARKSDLTKAEYIEFAKFALGVAKDLGIKLRWGGDWDMDGDYNDQSFEDFSHFELHEA